MDHFTSGALNVSQFIRSLRTRQVAVGIKVHRHTF
jgi:hypothetical protein